MCQSAHAASQLIEWPSKLPLKLSVLQLWFGNIDWHQDKGEGFDDCRKIPLKLHTKACWNFTAYPFPVAERVADVMWNTRKSYVAVLDSLYRKLLVYYILRVVIWQLGSMFWTFFCIIKLPNICPSCTISSVTRYYRVLHPPLIWLTYTIIFPKASAA